MCKVAGARRWRLLQTAVVKVPTVPMLVKRTLSPRTPIRGDDLSGRRDGASLNGVCGWCCRHSVPEPSPCHDVNTAGVVDSSFPEKRPCGAWRHTPVARLPPRTKECQDMLKPSCTGSGGALRNEHVTSIIIDSCGKAFERVAPRTVGCTEVLRANGTLERARRPSRSRLTDDPRVPGSSGASAGVRRTGLAVSERLRRRQHEQRCGCVAWRGSLVCMCLNVVVADVPCIRSQRRPCRPEASARTYRGSGALQEWSAYLGFS